MLTNRLIALHGNQGLIDRRASPNETVEKSLSLASSLVYKRLSSTANPLIQQLPQRHCPVPAHTAIAAFCERTAKAIFAFMSAEKGLRRVGGDARPSQPC
ncbi:MAG: hypothetical protein LDLANPLL_00436 [Turneriella sp.]|nr:hypothetical protein [Turneriella sp.]